jgi:hypothetical protein
VLDDFGRYDSVKRNVPYISATKRLIEIEVIGRGVDAKLIVPCSAVDLKPEIQKALSKTPGSGGQVQHSSSVRIELTEPLGYLHMNFGIRLYPQTPIIRAITGARLKAQRVNHGVSCIARPVVV